MSAAVENNAAGTRRQAPANEFMLTSFNPFQEDDELDQSGYAYVSSLFSKMRNPFAAAPSSKPAPPPAHNISAPTSDGHTRITERKGTLSVVPKAISKAPAPPLVSVTPVISETPRMQDVDSPVSRTGLFGFATSDNTEGPYGTAIPGFPIADDARSIKTSTSVGHKRTASVSKVIRRLRGEGTFTLCDRISRLTDPHFRTLP
jgi:1-phosphatidylinositol-3-phosphate 5-kinase